MLLSIWCWAGYRLVFIVSKRSYSRGGCWSSIIWIMMLISALLLEYLFDFLMQFLLIEHFDYRLIRIELAFPIVRFLFTNQVLGLVSFVDNHVVFSATCLSDFPYEIRYRAIALVDKWVNLRISFSHESRRRPTTFRIRCLAHVHHDRGDVIWRTREDALALAAGPTASHKATVMTSGINACELALVVHWQHHWITTGCHIKSGMFWHSST